MYIVHIKTRYGAAQLQGDLHTDVRFLLDSYMLHVTCFLAWFVHALENSICQWLTNNVSTCSSIVWEKFGIKNFSLLIWHDENTCMKDF